MAKVKDVIIKLEDMMEKHGNKEINIYYSFKKETKPLNEDNIYYDDHNDDIYLGVYN